MTARDIVMSAAGSAGDSKTYIEDVFSTYLYTGTNAAITINNGIDLAGKGGMVWLKGRSSARSHNVIDSARGTNYFLTPGSTEASYGFSDFGLSTPAFNSNGFTTSNYGEEVASGEAFASWTFRKAPKFFDVVTYTGNGSARTISHSLGQEPGMVIVKCTSTTGDWAVYHRSQPSASWYTRLNTTGTQSNDATVWNGTAPTSSVFSVGTSAKTNANGVSYVAYLFGHDTTADGLIQCGTYTGTGSTSLSVNLGWEPQYLLVKNLTGLSWSWVIVDNMRGMAVSSSTNPRLYPNTTNAEELSGDLVPTATGFTSTGSNAMTNGSGTVYIYMAIRRGPMRTPTDGTKVFNNVVRTGSGAAAVVNTTITPDLFIHKVRGTTGRHWWFNRLCDNYYLESNATTAEATYASGFPAQMWDNQTGYDIDNAGSNQNSTIYSYVDWVFKRAPGFFDVVCYTGDSTKGRTVNHNLGVVPELMIVKMRSAAGAGWAVYHKDVGNTKFLWLDSTSALLTDGNNFYWNSTTPTSSVFTLGNGAAVNGAYDYVAYLFASCPGVSKVGSYTGNGSSQTINCGFTTGARFVLIKRTDSTGDWYVWDTARGIVAATDPHLSLNTTAAEVTTDDTIDPDSTGFIVNQVAATNVNVSGGSYIYLAIA